MSNTKFINYQSTVIVTSDTCSKDDLEDTSGRYVCEALITYGLECQRLVVEDDKIAIEEAINFATSKPNNILTITVGGTGLCPRDVTPDVTSKMYEKDCSSLATALTIKSLEITPFASLSRLTAGIIGRNLIINFPGKLKACQECFRFLSPILGHALDQVIFDNEAIKVTHAQQSVQS